MIRKIGLSGIISLLLVCLVSTVVGANSLWNDNDSIFADDLASKEGDILTVLIEENATASQDASTDAAQDNSADIGAGTGFLDFIEAFGYEQSDSSSASGSTARSGNLSAEMTVQIIEVLENGNLKINGSKSVRINGEEQKIELTGIVRPQDITADNTIDSDYIANADISYDGQGAIADRQSQGIISRVLGWLF